MSPASIAPPPFTAAPPRLSFEFFPPKTPEAEIKLWEALKQLEPLGPRFVSVTYGAGGTTRERTRLVVERIRQETALPPAAHLTCVAATKEEVNEVARDYLKHGIRHIVALRGDPPESDGGVGGLYQPHPEGYAYAVDLVKGLKDLGDFEVSVAAYPETHPQAPSTEFDIDNLKRKFDAGADRAITQYFFETEAFLRFRDRCAAAGITGEIVPGMMPIGNFKTIVRFSEACGTTISDWLRELYGGLEEDADQRRLVSAAFCTEQCRHLMTEGVDSFHFYTLNRADLTSAVCRMLGVKAGAPAA